jgi:hypothetical protein
MSVKSIRKGLHQLVGGDPNDAAICSFCGAHRSEVPRIVEGSAGYICEGCVFAAAGDLAARDTREGRAAATTFHVVALALDYVDARTPHAGLEPVFDAALALVEGDPSRCRRLAARAFRLHHFARAAEALLRIDETVRTVTDALATLAALVTVGDRPAIARVLAALDPIALSDLHRLQRDVHRGWAAYRLEASAGPTFTFDGESLGPIVARLRALDAPASLGQALEVAAAYERTRDRDAALRRIEEALGVEDKPSRRLLRGDILADVDPAAARASWEAALGLAHPDSVWAARARARIDGARPFP